jgi:hypothetical protein
VRSRKRLEGRWKVRPVPIVLELQQMRLRAFDREVGCLRTVRFADGT